MVSVDVTTAYVSIWCILQFSHLSKVQLAWVVITIPKLRHYGHIFFLVGNMISSDIYCKVRNISVLKFSELIHFSMLANRNISV